MPAARTEKTTASKAGKNASKDGAGQSVLFPMVPYHSTDASFLVVFRRVAKEVKEKRAPTAYNIFVKEQMPIWKAEVRDLALQELLQRSQTYQSPLPLVSVEPGRATE